MVHSPQRGSDQFVNRPDSKRDPLFDVHTFKTSLKTVASLSLEIEWCVFCLTAKAQRRKASQSGFISKIKIHHSLFLYRINGRFIHASTFNNRKRTPFPEPFPNLLTHLLIFIYLTPATLVTQLSSYPAT
jgi:hypothetical protein